MSLFGMQGQRGQEKSPHRNQFGIRTKFLYSVQVRRTGHEHIAIVTPYSFMSIGKDPAVTLRIEWVSVVGAGAYLSSYTGE